MRFIVISDVHGRDRVIRWTNRLVSELEADGVIVLGDITHFGPPGWAGEFLGQLKGSVYAIPGNCDPPGVLEQIEKHAVSLHRKKITLEGHVLVGFGGSNPTVFETPFEMSEDEIAKRLAPLAEKGMVLISHCPPQGYLDMVTGNRHVGSLAIRKVVETFVPEAVVSGHIHEARGLVREPGTVFMNPGAAKDSWAGVLELGDTVDARLLDRIADQ